MIPSALIFSRYRAFKERVKINLRPLTIIIGKNGSGKSVVTRLPLLISEGVSARATSPLDLRAGGISHGLRYEDLIYQRSALPFTIGAEIGNGERSLEFETTLRFVVQGHRLAVEKFDLKENGRHTMSLCLRSPDDLTSDRPVYVITTDLEANSDATRAVFSGLLPHRLEEDRLGVQGKIDECCRLFQEAFRPPVYLGPFRAEPSASVSIPQQGIRSLGPRGDRAIEILADDVMRGSGNLAREVERWFEKSMNGARVSIKYGGDLPRLVVLDTSRNIDVDLAETGAGFAQVLPIVVQALVRRHGRISASLLITEQPELHLHPAAHGAIADLLIEAACDPLAPPGVRYLCETHSEQIIMRVRRRVAEGKLSPDAVHIISVGHCAGPGEPEEPVRVVKLDKTGTPESWPWGVFDEAFGDLVEIRSAAEMNR